ALPILRRRLTHRFGRSRRSAALPLSILEWAAFACRLPRPFSSVLLQERDDAGRAARVGDIERRDPVARNDVRGRAFLEKQSDELLATRFVMRVQPVDILDPQPRRPMQ